MQYGAIWDGVSDLSSISWATTPVGCFSEVILLGLSQLALVEEMLTIFSDAVAVGSHFAGWSRETPDPN